MGEPGSGLAPPGRRGPGYRHRRPHREGTGRTGCEGAAAGAVRLGVQPRHPRTGPPPEIAGVLGWAECASLPVAELEDTATVRLALGACARTLAGKAAAGSTQRRKRSVFYNALGYAVEQGHLPSNPVDRIQWTAPRRRGERRPAGGGQPRPGRGAPERRRAAGRAPEGVLRLPLLRGAGSVGGGHAPRGRPAPAEDRVGTDRLVGLGVPGRAGLDRRGHRPPGTRPEAPRR